MLFKAVAFPAVLVGLGFALGRSTTADDMISKVSTATATWSTTASAPAAAAPVTKPPDVLVESTN